MNIEASLLQLIQTVDKTARTVNQFAEEGKKDREEWKKEREIMKNAVLSINKTAKKLEQYISTESEVIEKEINGQFEKEAKVNKCFRNYYIYNIRAAWKEVYYNTINNDPKKMINNDYRNRDSITEFDGIFLASPYEYENFKFLDDPRIECINKPRNTNSNNKSPFFIILEAKRHIFVDWTEKINHLRKFQKYILDSNDINNPDKKFTREFKEKVEKFELSKVTPEMFLYYGGERFIADEQFLNHELVKESKKLKNKDNGEYPIHIGYIKLIGDRYGVYNLDNDKFIESNNVKVNSITTCNLTFSRQGGRAKNRKLVKQNIS
jgi:hypothetical protein